MSLLVKRAALGLLLLGVVTARFALAAAPDPSTLLKVDASVSAASEAGRGTLVLRATLASGWHVNSHKPTEEYLIPTTVTLAAAPGVKFGEPRFPEGKMEKFSFSETPLSVYAHDFTIEVPLEWTGAAAPSLSGSVEYQACNDTQCLAPASVAFRTGGAAAAAAGRPPRAIPRPLSREAPCPSRKRAAFRAERPRRAGTSSRPCSRSGAFCSCF